MFCIPELVSRGTNENEPSYVFMFCAPGHVFNGAECVGSRFHVLCAETSFWRYRGRRVPFSYFSLSDLFLTVRRAPGPVFMFCASRLVFGGNEGVGSCFHALRSRSNFPRYRGSAPLSSFVHPDSLLAVPWATDPVFMFCDPGLVFGCTEGVRSHFHVLRSRTHFRRYRGRRFSFSCFARPDSFLLAPRASGPDFMF
jgi:hypothetical protein